MADDAVCTACGWAGDIDDLVIDPRENAIDLAVCPDCLSTDVQAGGDD